MEVAFYHKRSRTLLVTDAVIFVPRKPPSSISSESLLASAKNGLAVKILSKGKQVPDDPVVDTPNTRQKGLLLEISNSSKQKDLNVASLTCRMGKNGTANPVPWSF